MRILHISDIHLTHIGSGGLLIQELKDCFTRVGISVDATVCTGDLLDSSWRRIRTATAFLESLSAMTGSPVLFCPGNHDIRVRGLWPDVRWWRNRAFRRAIRQWTDPAVVKEVLLFPIDSNTGFRLRAQGCLSKTELSRITQFADLPPHFCRVAIVHHHVAHMLNQGRTDELAEPSMVMTNAAHLLRRLRSHNFAVVLHGHRHITHEQVISDSPTGVGIAISSIASLSYKRSPNRIGAFSIIDVSRADVTKQRFEAGHHVPFEYKGTVSLLRRLPLIGTPIATAERVTRIAQINASGDVHNQLTFTRLSIGPGATLPIHLRADTGVFGQLRASVPTAHINQVETIDPSGWKRLDATIGFDLAMEDGHTDNLTLFLFSTNVFALSREEREYAVGEGNGIDDFAELPITIPVLSAELRIEFPLQLLSSEVACWATVEGNNLDDRTRSSIARELTERIVTSERSGTVSLNIPTPITGCAYAIHWRLPSAHDMAVHEEPSFMFNSPAARRAHESVSHDMLKIRQEMTRLLSEMAVMVPDITIDVMTLDHNIKRLRTVAASENGDEGLRLMIGEGVAGRAFKTGRCVACSVDVTKPDGIYKKSPHAAPHAAVLAIPIRYSSPQGDIIVPAVVSFKSRDAGSRLKEFAMLCQERAKFGHLPDPGEFDKACVDAAYRVISVVSFDARDCLTPGPRAKRTNDPSGASYGEGV